VAIAQPNAARDAGGRPRGGKCLFHRRWRESGRERGSLDGARAIRAGGFLANALLRRENDFASVQFTPMHSNGTHPARSPGLQTPQPSAITVRVERQSFVRMGGQMRKPWIIAHRGASGYAPENTLAAYQRAVELGVPFIETDLHLTRDARFVAIHDKMLQRTTNGRGAVHDHTLAQLRELDAGLWFDRQYAGEHIPTLEDVLAFARRHDVVFYLEIKYDAAWGMHHALVAALLAHKASAQTIVISFDPATLRSVRELDASIMTGLLSERGGEDLVKTALEVGARQILLRHDAVTRELVDGVHAADLHVVTWTVNEVAGMRATIATGVDGVMTDLPDRLRALVEDFQ
jgi:glycerophosphoryl diester phosphodiesterase